LLNSCNEQFGKPREAVVMDRYYACREPVRRFFPNTDLSKWKALTDIINNNPIEAFNGQFLRLGTNPKEGLSLLICKSSDFPFCFLLQLCQNLILH